jgi:hypothetical protein
MRRPSRRTGSCPSTVLRGVIAIDRAPGAPRGRRESAPAVEHRPADLVAQPLIVQDEFADRFRQLFTLPTTLEPAGARAVGSGGRRTRGLDRVGRGTELVRGDVRHRRRLAGGERGVPSSSAQLSSGSHGMTGRRTGLRHPDLTARPGANLIDRVAGPWIRGLLGLEEVQNVLCARCCPQSQEPMVGVRERAPATDRDEARVALLGEDHMPTLPPGAIVRRTLTQPAKRSPHMSRPIHRRDR